MKEHQNIKHYTTKLQKIEESLGKLKRELEKIKRRNIINDIGYIGIKEIQNLFNEINEEDCYRLIKFKHALNDEYVEYESRGDEDNILSIWEYFNMIRPYLIDTIYNHKAQGDCKIQLIMRVIFVSSIDRAEFRVLHTKSDNVEIMISKETNDIIDQLLNSFIKRCQEGLETKMKGSEFIYDKVDLLYYKLHKY